MKKLFVVVIALFAMGVSVVPVAADVASVGVRSNVQSNLALQSALLPAACGPFDATLFPGDSASKTCTFTNPNAQDAGLLYSINNVVVRDGDHGVRSGTDATTFKSFFKIDVESQEVLTTGPTDLAHLPTFRTRCETLPIDAVNDCQVMRIRGTNNDTPVVAPNSRDFRITIHFLDIGNQNDYLGWYITFTEVYGACLPASCAPEYQVPID